MGQMARKPMIDDGAGHGGNIDLKPFINFLVVLIPVLMLSAEFAKISVINLKLPAGRGSQTESASKTPPPEEEDKLLLTMIITDSVVTLGAKNGFMPSLFYKEFHHYVSRTNRNVDTTVEVDPTNTSKEVINVATGTPYVVSERQEILLYVSDENKSVVRSIYTKKDNIMLTTAEGNPMQSVKPGDTVYTAQNPRKMLIVSNPDEFELRPLSAYDEMRNRLLKISERYKEAPDREDIILAAENTVAYDKIVQLMDVAREAGFPNLSIAKLRG